MILQINTQDKKIVSVALKKDIEVISRFEEENEYGSQVLLPLIDKLLTQNSIKFQDLKEIEVATGPGSFTGVRVGVSIANALGFSLGIPVNGKGIETNIEY